MDIYCPRCGEPWDFDCIHEEVDERKADGRKATYEAVAAEFRAKGCEALATAYGVARCERSDGLRPQIASVAYDMLGDDMDGAASMMEDARWLFR